jgi:hypothetical protein
MVDAEIFRHVVAVIAVRKPRRNGQSVSKSESTSFLECKL